MARQTISQRPLFTVGPSSSAIQPSGDDALEEHAAAAAATAAALVVGAVAVAAVGAIAVVDEGASATRLGRPHAAEGATLWTDFKLFGAEHRNEHGEIARSRMTDFRRIRVSPSFSRMTPRAWTGLHARARAWLSTQLDTSHDGPTVVVTHHAPTATSVAPEHRDDPLCAAYASDLASLLDGRAALWVHGHTHFFVDHVVGGTRVVSNQRGYPDEPADGFRETFIVEFDASGRP